MKNLVLCVALLAVPVEAHAYDLLRVSVVNNPSPGLRRTYLRCRITSDEVALETEVRPIEEDNVFSTIRLPVQMSRESGDARDYTARVQKWVDRAVTMPETSHADAETDNNFTNYWIKLSPTDKDYKLLAHFAVKKKGAPGLWQISGPKDEPLARFMDVACLQAEDFLRK
jgi:hypothetical protein